MARKNAAATKEALKMSTFGASNQIVLQKGLLQSPASKSSPPLALFLQSVFAQSKSRSLFNCLAVVATFAWIPAPGVPAASFYRCPLPYSICTPWFPGISF